MKIFAVVGHKFRILTVALLICVGMTCLAPVDSGAATRQPRRKVLVLYSWHDQLPWQAAVRAGLQERLQQEPEENRPEMYEERFDGARIKDPAMDGMIYDYLKNKYASVRFDAVITESTIAAHFLLRHPDLFPREKWFALHMDQDRDIPSGQSFKAKMDPAQALLTILQVMPDREHLVAVVEDSVEGRWIKAELATAASPPALRVPLEIIDNFSFDELYEKVRNLSPRSAILYFPTLHDRTGTFKIPRDVVQRLSAIANAPVFVHHDTFLGAGVVGGYVNSAHREGELIGRIALGLPLPVSVAETDAVLKEYKFDSAELQRWHIPEKRLPAPHTLINRKLSLWDTHRQQVIGVLAAILFETILIVALVYFLLQRKMMVKLLVEKRDQLEQRVQERSAELRISNELLQKELAERNSAEILLRESEEKHRIMFMDSPDAYLIIRDGVFVDCNRASEAMLRGDRNRIVGHTPDSLSPEFQPDGKKSSQSAEEKIEETFRTGSSTFEWLHHRFDGTEFFVEVSIALMLLEGKQSLFISWRDITGRKQAEKELQAKNSELERFSYTVSHDLKSPLVTIKSFSSSIKQDLASGRHDRLEKDLGRIGAAADKMAALLDDLLRLSRAGHVINAPAPVDMAKLVDDVLKNLSGTLKEQNVQVSVQPDLPTIPCDRQRMMEVVQNLVENAVKYRGDQPEPRIVIGVREEEGRQVFFVQDNGPGIDLQYHENIFGLFNRLDTQVPGTGIGLALVKRIIEVHGGSIWVESDGQGNGCTFCFTVGKGNPSPLPLSGESL